MRYASNSVLAADPLNARGLSLQAYVALQEPALLLSGLSEASNAPPQHCPEHRPGLFPVRMALRLQLGEKAGRLEVGKALNLPKYMLRYRYNSTVLGGVYLPPGNQAAMAVHHLKHSQKLERYRLFM